MRGLGGDENEVSSPTFALMNQYEGRLTVYHFDLYRLGGPDEVYDLGFEGDLLRRGNGCAQWNGARSQAIFLNRCARLMSPFRGRTRRAALRWREFMIFLTLDASSSSASVSVTKDDVLVYESYLNNGLTHSSGLMPMVEDALRHAGLDIAQIDVFGCGGAGSFTGVRIGVATVKGAGRR